MKLLYHFAGVCLIFLCAAIPFNNLNAQDSSEKNIWGYVFGDLFWKADGDNVTWGRGEYMGTEKGMTGGALRRLYLGYDHQISEQFSTRVLLEANQGTLLPNGTYGTMIKLGYLQWKAPDFIFYNQQVNVGLIPTPIFSFPERAWGYRSVEKEALDARGIGRSVDQGVSYSASIDPENNYGFTLLVGNGSGARPAQDRFYEYTGSAFGRLFDQSLSLEIMANYKYQGNGLFSSIYRGFLGLETGALRFGFEAALIRENIDTGTESITRYPILYSGFAAVETNLFYSAIEFFVRYDMYNPDREFEDSKSYPADLRFVYDQSMLIVGANYKPIPEISIMPNVYMNLYDDKRATTESRKNDFILRLTLYYRF